MNWVVSVIVSRLETIIYFKHERFGPIANNDKAISPTTGSCMRSGTPTGPARAARGAGLAVKSLLPSSSCCCCIPGNWFSPSLALVASWKGSGTVHDRFSTSPYLNLHKSVSV